MPTSKVLSRAQRVCARACVRVFGGYTLPCVCQRLRSPPGVRYCCAALPSTLFPRGLLKRQRMRVTLSSPLFASFPGGEARLPGESVPSHSS